MFCILQTLHLIPHNVYPKPAFLIPFSKYSLIQSPSLPSDFSLISLGRFASQLAATPFAFAFTYVLVRPFVEEKIYRLIRRHLPKQERPDEVSIQVAMENDLLEWTLPIAGRRMEEETRRSNLSLLEDIREELRELQNRLFRWLGYNHDDSDEKISDCPSHNDIDTVREDILPDSSIQNNPDQVPILSTDTALNVNRPASLVPDQTLTNEQLTHSPGEITPNAINEVHPTERAERGEIVQDQVSGSWIPFQDYEQDSRANTLFSRPRTPESPLASPRIRASLTHQNSFTTTMELSLQDSRGSNRQDNLGPVVEIERGDTSLGEWPIPLDESQLDSEVVLQQVRREIDALEQLTTEADAGDSSVLNPTENEHRWESLNMELDTNMALEPVLPHVVEEPTHSPTHRLGMDALSDAGTEVSASNLPPDLAPWRSPNENRSDVHKQRVTVLSSYPADALAHHLASIISGVIFLPFESFFYRSLARAYLSSHLASVYAGHSLVPISNIRGLTGFAGGGGRLDMVAYMCKLVLIQGIQTGISGAILGVCSATAIGIGKRVFNWGNL